MWIRYQKLNWMMFGAKIEIGNENERIQHTANPDKRTQKNTKAHCYNGNIRKSFKTSKTALDIFAYKTNDERKMMSEHLNWICKCSLNCNNFTFPIVLIPATESCLISFKFSYA